MTADSNLSAATGHAGAPPGAVGSLGAFWPLIEPVLGALAPRALCEVGVESGAFAARLLAWCRAQGCRYFGVDPAEVDDPDFLRNVTASGGRFIQSRSSEALPSLELCNAYFLDGDHNFFTVRAELAAIAQRTLVPDVAAGAGPVIFVHDVGWPWGRRDMYYAPETIPAEDRHEFSLDLGVRPADDGLVDGGLRAPGRYAIAKRAGGARNGVLTAVENFLADAQAAGARWEMFLLPVAYGLGVLYRPETVPDECRRRLEDLRATTQKIEPFLRTLESNYLDLYLYSDDLLAAYHRLQTYADGVQAHARGLAGAYRDLEVAYQALLTHADRLLKDYHLLEDHRQGLEAANARLLAEAASAAATHPELAAATSLPAVLAGQGTPGDSPTDATSSSASPTLDFLSMQNPSAQAWLARYQEFLARPADAPATAADHELHRILVHYPQLTRWRRTNPGALPTLASPFGEPVPGRAWEFGMTTLEEQAYCEWFGSHLYRGVGQWIELGTFLGSLTMPSVRGLEANPRPAVRASKVRVFDLFHWDFVMTDCVRGTPLEGCCKDGDWYVDFYRRRIAEVLHRVEVNQADLTQHRYSGEPIEFLVVDIMKYEALVVNVLREFFSRLLPGAGYVFHQDYLHFYEGWATLSMFNLRDCFDYVCALENTAVVIFRCRREPSPEQLEFPLKSSDISQAWIEEAFAWSFSITDPGLHHLVAATKVMMLVHSERREEACRLYREGVARFPDSYSFRDLHAYVKNARQFDLAQ